MTGSEVDQGAAPERKFRSRVSGAVCDAVQFDGTLESAEAIVEWLPSFNSTRLRIQPRTLFMTNPHQRLDTGDWLVKGPPDEDWGVWPDEQFAVDFEPLPDPPVDPAPPENAYTGERTLIHLAGGTTVEVAHTEKQVLARLKRGAFVNFSKAMPFPGGLRCGGDYWVYLYVGRDVKVCTELVAATEALDPLEPRYFKAPDPFAGIYVTTAEDVKPEDVKFGPAPKKRWWRR